GGARHPYVDGSARSVRSVDDLPVPRRPISRGGGGSTPAGDQAMRSSTRAIPALALLAATMAPAVRAQQTVPTFRGGVDVVFVPVSVSDRNRPVSGLGPKDFVLLDSGVPQE